MVSAFTHAYFALTLRAVYPADPRRVRLTALGMVCSMLPDADVLGYWSGVPYEHVCGHRGITHSLLFAIVLGIAAGSLAFRDARLGSKLWLTRVRYLSFATLSHAVLDMLTNGGLGIAFLAPFSDARWFFPWRPIEVAPLSVSAFFTEAGLAVFVSELLWVWVPATVLAALALAVQRRRV